MHAGEAQKIDRIMEKFAERYCRDNPGAFATADAAYLLAFALIMLNTDAHNPHADKKLAPADFISMCQAQVLINNITIEFHNSPPCWLRFLVGLLLRRDTCQDDALPLEQILLECTPCWG